MHLAAVLWRLEKTFARKRLKTAIASRLYFAAIFHQVLLQLILRLKLREAQSAKTGFQAADFVVQKLLDRHPFEMAFALRIGITNVFGSEHPSEF